MPYDFELPTYDYSPAPVDPEEIRRQQAASIQQHIDYAQNLQELQGKVNLRGEDLDISKQLLQATSPQVPKGAREFLLKGISTAVGVDPKGDYAGGLIKMVSGLDPQSLEQMRAAFGSNIPDASPGQIKAQVRAVFSGQVKVSDLLTRVAQYQPAPDRLGGPEDQKNPWQTTVTPGEPPNPTYAGSAPGSTPGTAAPPPPTRPRVNTPTPEEVAAGNIRRYPTVGETAPRDQPTDPGLMHELGLDPNQQARNDDVLKVYPGIPVDAEGQRKLRTQLQDQSAQVSNAVKSAMDLHNLFRGRPETLGVTGMVTRGIDEVASQINAAARTFGAGTEQFDMDSKGIRTLVQSTADKIAKLYKDSGLEGTAVDSARIQSQTLQMAYDMAIARGIPGNRLTNSIIGQQLQTLGKSGSVAQFEGVLKDLVQRSLDEGAGKTAATLGSRNFYPGLANVPDDDLKQMVRYAADAGDKSIIPDRYKAKMLEEMQLRANEAGAQQRGEVPPQRGQQIQLASPTIQEEQAALRQRTISDETRRQAETTAKISGEERAQARADREQRLEVMKFEAAQRSQMESDRRYELAVKKEERQALYQKQQQIIHAFGQLGSAIAGAVKGGGGIQGISAPEQDSGAFRLNPYPKRQAPQPVDASRFQRGQR